MPATVTCKSCVTYAGSVDKFKHFCISNKTSLKKSCLFPSNSWHLLYTCNGTENYCVIDKTATSAALFTTVCTMKCYNATACISLYRCAYSRSYVCRCSYGHCYCALENNVQQQQLQVVSDMTWHVVPHSYPPYNEHYNPSLPVKFSHTCPGSHLSSAPIRLSFECSSFSGRESYSSEYTLHRRVS